MAAQAWEKTLRKQIKDNHGFGWNVIAQSGKCKLTRRYEDGTKSVNLLPEGLTAKPPSTTSETLTRLVLTSAAARNNVLGSLLATANRAG